MELEGKTSRNGEIDIMVRNVNNFESERVLRVRPVGHVWLHKFGGN